MKPNWAGKTIKEIRAELAAEKAKKQALLDKYSKKKKNK
jgi:hypothetical protein